MRGLYSGISIDNLGINGLRKVVSQNYVITLLCNMTLLCLSMYLFLKLIITIPKIIKICLLYTYNYNTKLTLCIY